MLNVSVIYLITYFTIILKIGFNLFCIQDTLILYLINKNIILLLALIYVVYLCSTSTNYTPKFFLIYTYVCILAIKQDFVSLEIGLNSSFGLSNKVSLVHPILVILTISSIIALLIIYTEFQSKRTVYLFRLNTTVILYALLTGSYWSSQEVLWGGWWSWDLVETSLFLIFILFIIVVHSIGKKKKSHRVYLIQNNMYLILYIVYLTNHTPIINSIHSFVSTSSMFLSYSQLVFWLLIPIYILNTRINHYIMYLVSLYYILTIKYIYASILGLSITSELTYIRLFLIGYITILSISSRRKRFLIALPILFGYKILLVLITYNLLYTLFIPMLPLSSILYLSIKKNVYFYRHSNPFIFITVYYLFFLSYTSVPRSSLYVDTVFSKSVLLNYANLLCTGGKISYNGSIYSLIGDSFRPKLYFNWFNIFGTSSFGIKSTITSTYIFSNFI